MIVIAVLLRPRLAFAYLASAPSLRAGFIAVLAAGVVSALIQLLGTVIAGGGGVDHAIAFVLPVLFLAYWVASGLIVDAGAGLFRGAGRWRAFLAVSGFTFVPWIAYAVLSLAESAALRLGSGDTVASAISWLTLPLLVWFLGLVAIAVHSVYDVSAMTAVALAMLPDAVLVALLTAVLLVADVLRATGAP